MAYKWSLKKIKEGVAAWNKWRELEPELEPDLSYATLSGKFKEDAPGVNGGRVMNVYNGANFRGVNLEGVDFSIAWLEGADFSNANLTLAKFDEARLTGANFSNAKIGWTKFVDNDLSEVNGLDTVKHIGPSTTGFLQSRLTIEKKRPTSVQ